MAMGEDTLAVLEMAEIAASSDPLPRRAEQALAVLHRVVPFASAWLALVDPRHPDYTTLADAALATATRAFLAGPVHARELELAGTTVPMPPLSPSDLPFSAEELLSWAECLIPAGYSEGLAVALCAPGARHIGFLAVLSESKAPPPPEVRRGLGRLVPLVGRAVDPLQSLAAARAELDAGGVHRSFLWPLGGRHAPGGHARITVLARAQDLPVRIAGIAVASDPGDLHGLTARELEVLGLIVEGCTNSQIASTLVVSRRTVAAHVEHILAKLPAPPRA